jgi:hypothetical protein
MMPHCVMEKRLSTGDENALDNAGNSGPAVPDARESRLYRPILAH